MKSTCFAVLIFAALLYSVAGHQGNGHRNHPGHEKFKQVIETCVQEKNLGHLTQAEIRERIFGKREGGNEVADDICLNECIMKKLGSMDENGNIVMPKEMEGKHIEKSFKECETEIVASAKPCEKARDFQKCLNDKRPPRQHPPRPHHQKPEEE